MFFYDNVYLRGRSILSDIENDYMYLKLSKVKNLINIILVIATILYIVYF